MRFVHGSGSNTKRGMSLVYGVESSELGSGFSIVSDISFINSGSTTMFTLDASRSYVNGLIILLNINGRNEDGTNQ